MHTRLVLLLIASLLAGCATKRDRSDHELGSWGTAINPNADCKLFVSGSDLVIYVPGGSPHDLAPEIGLVNAPRVLQTVEGDFTVQVRIDGRFAPGDESTKAGRRGYNGAGITAIADTQNVVTLARAVLQHPGKAAVPYANFEIRVHGRLQRIGLTTDHPLPKDGPVFLRLERRDSRFLGAVSTDGVTWNTLAPKEVPAEWPKELQAGVIAISTSKDEFTPRFSRLQMLK